VTAFSRILGRCTGKDCCQVLGFICSVGIRAHWKHCVCNSGGTLLFLYHLYHHYVMYHQRLEAFCTTDPTSISTNQSQKVAVIFTQNPTQVEPHRPSSRQWQPWKCNKRNTSCP
jgi:hypothetical protein